MSCVKGNQKEKIENNEKEKWKVKKSKKKKKWSLRCTEVFFYKCIHVTAPDETCYGIKLRDYAQDYTAGL